MELTHELRENAGFQWVLERLSPMSPFGKQAARNPRWYGPGDEAALEEELDNVALAMELWAAGGTRPQPVDSCGCEAPRVNRRRPAGGDPVPAPVPRHPGLLRPGSRRALRPGGAL